MCIENKINLYNSLRNESEKFVDSLSDVDWYGDKGGIEEKIVETDSMKRIDELNYLIENLVVEREWIRMSEWNEKLNDSLRALKRFLLKNRKDYATVESCLENLEFITVVEL